MAFFSPRGAGVDARGRAGIHDSPARDAAPADAAPEASRDANGGYDAAPQTSPSETAPAVLVTDRITLAHVRASPEVNHYIERANEILGAIGYTEHGKRHHRLCAKRARELLEALGRPRRVCELAEVAAYLHDIGNIVNRNWHAQSGAQIAHSILCGMGMPVQEVTEIIAAIGHHDEVDGFPVNALSAAVIIADKSDVHRSRVREKSTINFDIHDRVNYAVTRSVLSVETRGREMEQAIQEAEPEQPMQGLITLHLTIDTSISPVMEYFEIFLPRMILSRRAAEKLSCVYKLQVNGADFL
jgi:metal-dependent HD superfamily phosphatase/phosphodiesterase